MRGFGLQLRSLPGCRHWFEIERVASADSSMAATAPQFRGFSRLLVYNAATQFAVRCRKKAESNAQPRLTARHHSDASVEFSADASGAVLGKINDRDAVAVAEDK